jgi:adenylate cyclase
VADSARNTAVLDRRRGVAIGSGRMANKLRLYSGLVLFVFVIGHLVNHSLGLISLTAMNAALD